MPPSPAHLSLAPAELAGRCRRLGLPGFVWLDSALPAPGAISLLAAGPAQMHRGAPADWPRFEQAAAAFAECCPGGAVVGWVEYSGEHCFGFYERPMVYRHDSAVWEHPGGTPPWLGNAAARPPSVPLRWQSHVHFRAAMAPAAFCSRVEQAQAHIAAGDIYQVNLAHRFQAAWPADADPFALYLRLREQSPAPQAAFLEPGDRAVLCASPEEFLRLDDRKVRTRPIKGTRPRDPDPARDAANARELVASPKERAELLMITDLLRNDLGAICEFGSVRVLELLRLEEFAQVFHLVSTVEGTLRAGLSHPAALHACLPGGSITGAPKRRAREIIAELEPIPRGLYTGSIGCFGPGRASRFNIVIRTVVVENGQAHFHVGSGIVADSDPAAEWEETLHKAAGLLAAINAGR